MVPHAASLDNGAEARGRARARPQPPRRRPGSQLAEPAGSSGAGGATASAGLSHTQRLAHGQEPNPAQPD